MDCYAVVFNGTPWKEYFYLSKLDLPIGGFGKIIADNETAYKNTVKISRKVGQVEAHDKFSQLGGLRVITDFQRTDARPNDRIKNVYFNKEKGTTCVLWDDGKKTVVHCSPNDTWDEEKALALCYMKRVLGNRGSFNETLKKYCYNSKENE